MATSITDKTIAEWAANSTSTRGLASTMASWANEDPIVTQTKFELLASNKAEKTNRLSNIVGLYDADSPRLSDGSTTRITESTYYAQAPELKDATGQLTREGINARIMADNYAMGMKNVPKYDLNSEIVDPRYYNQYREAMDALIKERVAKGQYNVYDTGTVDSLEYGRKLVKAQSSDMPMSQTDFLLQHGAAKKVDLAPTKRINMDNIEQGGKSITQQLMELSSQPIENKNTGSGIGNAAKAFVYMAGTGIANTLDLAVEGVQYLGSKALGNKTTWADTKGWFDKAEEDKFKNFVGYNDEVMNKLGQDASTAFHNAIAVGDIGGMLKVIGKGILTPEMWGSSLGYVVGMIAPGGLGAKAVQAISGVGKAAAAIRAADATGKMTKAEALAQAEDKAGKMYKFVKGAISQAGYVGEAEQFGRDAEVLYKQTYGEDMPIEQRMAARVAGVAYANLDAWSAKALAFGKDPIAKIIPEAVKKLPDSMKASFAGKVALVAGIPAARVVGAFGLEGSTEAVQTAMEKIAGQYKEDTAGIGEVLAKNVDEIGGAAILGGAGGIQMGGPALAVGAGKDIRSALSENLAELRQAGAEAVEAVTTPKPVETPMTFADIMKSLKTDLNTIDVFDQKQSALAIDKLNSLKALATEEDTEELDQLKLNFTSKINEKLAKVKTADGKIDTNVFGSDPAMFLEEFAYADEGRRTEVINALSSDSKYAKLGKALAELATTSDNKARDILDGIATVQDQITKGEFVTSKNVHSSMIDNYKLASSANEDEARIGIDKMQEFSLSQQAKKAKLEAGLNESLNRMNNTVNRLASARGLPVDTVIKALVDLEQLTITDKDGEVKRKGYMNDVLALTNADNIDAAKKIYKEAIKPILYGQVPTQGVQYSLGVLSQTAKNGVFEIDFKNTLAAYAENNNVEVQKKSAAKRLINSIDAEIQALDTLVATAGKNREAKKQAIAVLTETMDKVGIDTAELGQQEVVEKSIEKEKVTDVKSEKSIEKEKAASEELVKPVKAKKDTGNKDLKKAKQIVNNKLVDNSSYAEIKKAIDELTLEDTVKSNLLKYAQDKIGKRRIISDKKLEAVETKAELDKARMLVDSKITLFKELIKEGKELYTTNRSKLGRLYGEIRGYKDMVAEYTQQIKELSIDNIKAGKALDSLYEQRDTVIAKIKQLKREDKTSGDYESKLTALRDELKAIDEKISELQKDISRRRSLVTEALDERAKTEEKAKLVEPAVKEAEQETITKLSDKSKAIRARSNAEVAKIIGATKVKIKGKDEQLPLGEHKDGKYPFNIQLNKLYKAEYGSKLSDTAASDIEGVRTLATRAVELLSNEAVSKGKSKDNTFSESIMTLVDMARPLIYDGSGDNIKINENVATALAIATINVVDEAIVRMAEFDEELIEKYYGIAPDGLSAASKAQLEELGIPVKYLVEDIGRRTKEYLGIKLIKDTVDAKELNARIERSLGMHGLLMYSGDSKALITAKQTSSKDIAKLLNTVESKVNVDTVENTTPLVTTVSINKKVVAKAKSYIDPIINKLEVAEIDGAHKWEPIENINRKATIVRRNPFSKVPKAISDKVKEFMGYEWKIKQGTAFDKLKELGKDKILELEGYKTDKELASMVYDKRASTESKNMALAREVEYLFDVYNKVTSGEKNNALYFDWFVAKSFRMMIDSNEFNPQNKKLHRSMVYVDKMKSNIDVNDEKQMKAFLLGIAQAFGYDIDKGNNKAIEAAKKLLEVDTEELLNSIPTKGKEYEVPGTGLKIERPVLTHYLDGIQAIVDYQTREGDTFDTMLTVETDAVTNGAILKMMQYLQGPLNNTVGIGKNVVTNKELIKKGGILTEEYAQLDMTALRGSGTLEDSYQTQAKDVTEAKIMAAFHNGVNRKKNPVVLPKGIEPEEAITPLVNILGAGVKIEVIDGTEEQIAVVTKKGRELAKYPYMTFWYGAGKKKITGELADNLVEDLVQKLYDNELIKAKDYDKQNTPNTIEYADKILIIPAEEKSYAVKDTDTAVNVMRKYGKFENTHYGNPFGASYGAGAKVQNQGTDAEVSQMYEDWLKGTYRQDVEPKRRKWIIEQIKNGKLDGKKLMYFRNTPDNHAKRLVKLIVDKSWIAELDIETNLITNYPTKDKDVEALKKALKLTTADVKELKNKSVYSIPLDGTTVGATLKSWLAESYGAAMWGVLEDRFADIIEINDAINTSVRTMFEVWEQEYKKVIEERNAATIDEQNAIALELLELFPMLKIATSEGLSDSMALFSTKVVDRKLDSKYGRTGVYTKKAVGEKSGSRSMYIVDLVKEYAASKAAGGVLPIHALDSSNVATSAKDILQIWDAYMSGVGQTEDMAKAFNKATYENSMKWNYIEEVRNAITRVLGTKAGKNYLNKLNQEGSKDAATKLEKLQEVLELLKGKAAGNAEFKKALQEVPVSIQHMPYTKDSEYFIVSNNEKQDIIKPKDGIVKTMKANDIMAEVNKCKE